MKKVMAIVGTRPEAIKMAPVIRILMERPKEFETHLCSSGQHGAMLAQTLQSFGLNPDSSFNVMTENQSLAGLSARLFEAIDKALAQIRPDILLVQGDTTTVQVASLCAFYRGITVGHVEAGLRTGNMHAPFPEELNRRIVALVANWHYAPTETARKNLLAEGIDPENIIVTGNTVIDALFDMRNIVRKNPPSLPGRLESLLASNRPYILVTGHRRENFGKGVRDMCNALKEVARALPEATLVYPVHLNPNVREPVQKTLHGINNILLEEPVPYNGFVRLLDQASVILTDSGGIQEEGAALGKPVLVMRDTTERPEGIDAGASILVGTNPERIVTRVLDAFHGKDSCQPVFVYGDGHAAERIATHLVNI